MVRPFATTTPESLVFFPATSPLPPSVSISLYVASSLISSVTAPSIALPPPPSAPPTGRNDPVQVPTISRGTKERDTSDCVRLATASSGLCVAQPVSKTIRAVEARSMTSSRLTIEVFLPFRKRLCPWKGRVAIEPRPTRHSAFHWPGASYPLEKVKLRAKSRQRGEDRSCEGFRLRAETADAEGEWRRSIEMRESEQAAQDRTTATR